MKLLTTPDEFPTCELNRLHNRLNLWRSKQRERAPLPEAVWRSAAILAQSLGVSHVSRVLRLNYEKLNRWTAGEMDGPRDLPARATFVELAMDARQASEASHGYRVELADATTDKVTLHLGTDMRAVVAIAESFWRRKP